MLVKERRIVFVCFCMLFFVICSFVILKSLRDAVFLSRYHAASLPVFMAVSTALSAMVAAMYLRLYRHFPARRISQLSFLIFSIATYVFVKALVFSHTSLAAFLYLWVGIFGTIAPVQAWMMISWQFSTRQAKNVMGWVAAGATLGSITGGFLARWLSGRFGVWWLLPVAGGCTFAAFAISLFLKEDESIPESSLRPPEEETAGRRKFVKTLLALVAVGTIASTFIEFLFKTTAQAHYGSEIRLANFFGSFYAVMGILTLVLQITGIPPFLRRFGVAPSLQTLPGSLFLFNGVFLITGKFGAAAFLRGSEETFRHSIDRSTMEVLYIALPVGVRTRVKSLIETIGVRIPEAATSILLIILFTAHVVSFRLISILNLLAIVCWMVLAFLLGRKYYPSVLKEQIQGKQLDFEAVRENLFSKNFYRLLPDIFRNAEKETILDLLEIIETSKKRWLARYIIIPLHHDDRDVRLKSLLLLFDQDANLSSQVRPLMSDKDPRIRREAIHYLCLHSRSQKTIISKSEEHDDSAMQASFSACFRGDQLPDGSYNRLSRLLNENAEEPDVLLEIAHVLKYTRPSRLSDELLKRLLSDVYPDEVRKSALSSIEFSRPVALIPDLLNLTRHRTLATEVSSALAGYGAMLFPRIERLLSTRDVPFRQKKIAVNVTAEIGGQRALSLILKAAQQNDVSIRFAAIKALNRLKTKPLHKKFHRALVRLLSKEIRILKREIKRAQAFSPRPGTMMNRIVHQRIDWAAERVFRYLGLLYDSDLIYYSYQAWSGRNRNFSDAALELLEQTLSPRLRRTIIPVLEMQKEMHETATEKNRSQAFYSYMKEKDPLLAAAAIEELSAQELRQWLPEKKHIDSMMRETLNRRDRMTDDGRIDTDNPLTKIQQMEALGKIDLFSKLGPQELLLLADQAVNVHFDEGQVIFQEGEDASEMIALVDGEVELSRQTEPVSIISPGGSFGIHEVLTDQPRFFSAVATRSSSGLRITRQVLTEIMDDYSSVGYGIIQVLVRQVQSLTEQRSLLEKS